MRLGGRLSAAIDILSDIETRHRPVAEALKDWGLSHRFAGSGDRAAIGNIVYDALRLKLSHRWLMQSDEPAALGFAVLLRQWGYTAESLAAELDGDSFAPAAPSEMFETFASRDLNEAPPHVQADLPEWLQGEFETAFGEHWITEAQGLNGRPPLDLRVNRLKANREKVLKALARTGAVPTEIAPDGIRVAPVEGSGRHPNVTAELSFAKGWFEVQDEGSQIAALLTGASGGQVLDYCAGGGGKTLALAASMGNKGQIHAYDADRHRLAPIVERLKRAGTRNVQVHDQAAQLEPLQGRCDHVLIDAPCTGTGTWRRRPDAKWRLTPETLAQRMAEQETVLEAAYRFVKPGGELVYVTCSLLPSENAGQIARFRERHPEFQPVEIAARWESTFEKALPAHADPENGMVTLTPATTATDGFFVSVMRRLS
ncbi:MFS transporter [Rhizobium albus]|nr:MFS transporter [Rhizobium albus]